MCGDVSVLVWFRIMLYGMIRNGIQDEETGRNGDVAPLVAGNLQTDRVWWVQCSYITASCFFIYKQEAIIEYQQWYEQRYRDTFGSGIVVHTAKNK